MSFTPNLFLVGAQKAGTTYLASLLGQHPRICLSEPKEPAYFTRNLDRGMVWYRGRFKDPGATYFLDATTGYSVSPLPATDTELEDTRFSGVPGRIKAVSPHARILYIVREPVARTYAAYWHNVRAGHENRSFPDAVRNDSYYLRSSRYFDQLALYRQYFARESILVVTFDELRNDSRALVKHCFEFLGIDASVTVNLDQGHNRSFVYPAPLAWANQKFAKVGGINPLVKKLGTIIPKSTKDTLFAAATKRIMPMADREREFLMEYFKESNRMLAEEHQIDFAATDTDRTREEQRIISNGETEGMN